MPKQIVNISDTVKTFQEKVNIISADVGWRGNMTTTVDSDIVGGINELDSDIGPRPHTTLTTDAKNLTAAANELDARLDSINDTLINSAKLHMRDSAALNIIKGNLNLHGNMDIDGTLTVDGVVNFKAGTNGSVTLGDANTDNVVFSADVNSHIIPNTDSAYDLGSSTQQWRNLYIDGVGFIDNIQADDAKITGTLDVDTSATIATAKIEDLTDNRVVIVGTGGELEDHSGLTYDGSTLTVAGTLDVDTSATIATVKIEDLTDNRVVIVGTGGELEDDANLTFDGSTLTVAGTLDVNTAATIATAKVEDLTNNRVVIVGTGGELEDDANFTFDGTTFNLNGNVDVGNGLDVTGNITVTGTVDGRDIAADGTLLDTHDNELGTITAAAMGTTASTVSGAILELETEIDTLNTRVSPATAFGASFTATTVMGALNELKTQADLLDSGSSDQISQIGDLNSLDTTAKGNLVAAINELDDRIDTDLDFRNKVSATDGGGDGSFSYDQTSGVFTYTGPSASDVRAHFSGGTDIGISSGTINHDAISSTTSTATAATPGYGGSFTYVNDITVSTQGHVTDVETKQITLPAAYSLPEATATTRGGIELFSNTDQSVAANDVTATASRTYGIQLNSSGQAVVNVPWVDTNTTYSTATSSALGLVKIGYTESGKNYPVELDNGQMYVNVPWVDTNTTYSAGVDLDLTGTTFSLEPELNTVTDILNVEHISSDGGSHGLYIQASSGSSATRAPVDTLQLYSAEAMEFLSGLTSDYSYNFRAGTTNTTNRPVNINLINTDTSPGSTHTSGYLNFKSENSANVQTTYASIYGGPGGSTTDGAEDGDIRLRAMRSGSYVDVLAYDGGTDTLNFGSGTNLDLSTANNSTSLVIYNSAGTAVKTIYGTTG